MTQKKLTDKSITCFLDRAGNLHYPTNNVLSIPKRAAYAMLYSPSTGRALMVCPSYCGNIFELPGGLIARHETADASIRRSLKEQTPICKELDKSSLIGCYEQTMPFSAVFRGGRCHFYCEQTFHLYNADMLNTSITESEQDAPDGGTCVWMNYESLKADLATINIHHRSALHVFSSLTSEINNE